MKTIATKVLPATNTQPNIFKVWAEAKDIVKSETIKIFDHSDTYWQYARKKKKRKTYYLVTYKVNRFSSSPAAMRGL